MSASAVQEFLEKVQTDESLAQELIKALEAEDDRAAVAELAISKGYDITPEELWAEVQKRQGDLQQLQDAESISDEELESVAGGATIQGVGIPKKTIKVLSDAAADAAARAKW